MDSTLKDYFKDGPWDTPFFKCLALNDSGESGANQGGPNITKGTPGRKCDNISQFFPPARERDAWLKTEVSIDLKAPYSETMRYQWQDSKAEFRITQMGELHKVSKKGDLLVMQRHESYTQFYRFTLLQSLIAPYHSELTKHIQQLIPTDYASKNAGILFPDSPPLTYKQVLEKGKEEGRLLKETPGEFTPSNPSWDEEHLSEEGRVLLRLHKTRERDTTLVKKKKEQALENGTLTCEVCRFDFQQAYLGAAYIECHHVVPLSTLSSPTPITLDDLALVCANCHRMLHSTQAGISIDKLRERLRVQYSYQS